MRLNWSYPRKPLLDVKKIVASAATFAKMCLKNDIEFLLW